MQEKTSKRGSDGRLAVSVRQMQSNKSSEKFFTLFQKMWYTIACLNLFRNEGV